MSIRDAEGGKIRARKEKTNKTFRSLSFRVFVEQQLGRARGGDAMGGGVSLSLLAMPPWRQRDVDATR